MADKIKVRIYAEQTVRYSKNVDLTPEQVAEYDAAVERDERDAWFARWADRFIDPLNDDYGHDDYEQVEMTVLNPAN